MRLLGDTRPMGFRELVRQLLELGSGSGLLIGGVDQAGCPAVRLKLYFRFFQLNLEIAQLARQPLLGPVGA